MPDPRRLLVVAAGLSLLLLTLVACGPEPSPSPTPTKTLRPTFTPTSAAVAQATQTAVALAEATPTPTSTPTATPTPVSTDTPTPTDTPEPPTPTPTNTPAPTNTPQPVPTATPRPPQPPTPTPAPVVEDPCAGIGGDGCKFRLTQGPAFGDNGGSELKLQFLFVHSGVAGGQPQGSYFVWLERDGVKLPVSDGTRSVALESSEGRLGRYNYEYKLGLNSLPGNTVAGCYRIWVLDGNGERDSQTFEFCVPEGQGEVWAVFDQA